MKIVFLSFALSLVPNLLIASNLNAINVYAERSFCSGDDCYVDIVYEGFDDLGDDDFLVEKNTYPECGMVRESSLLLNPENLVVRGRSRTILSIYDSRGKVAKLCKLSVLKAANDGSPASNDGYPKTTLYFSKKDFPQSLKVILKDRLNSQPYRHIVLVPPPEKPRAQCRDGVPPMTATASYAVEGVKIMAGETRSWCIDVPEDAVSIDVGTLNHASSNCGSRKLTLRHVNSVRYPNVTVTNQSGSPWARLTQLGGACGFRKPGCQEKVPAGRYEIRFEGIQDARTQACSTLTISINPS